MSPMFVAALILAGVPALPSGAARPGPFTDYRDQTPGRTHLIRPADLPAPNEAESVDHGPRQVPRPKDAWPKAPAGFKVEVYASDLINPRLLRVAPNGDIFVAESEANLVRVFRGVGAGGRYLETHVFSKRGLTKPFGLAFYPPGPNPRWLYVANTDSVVRFPYANGDLATQAAPETVVPDLPGGGQLRGGGHWTRDIAFSRDGKRMFVSVGSHSNVDDPDQSKVEFHRAAVLAFTPEGGPASVYASGIRNAVGVAIHPKSGALWVSVNERDGLGDNLVPDYITSVKEGGFYGWPWFFIGGNQDPRHAGKHAELRGKVIVPDVLVQPHNASLQLAFYDGQQFPADYRGDIFAAQHGSWNRGVRTGYEVIRVPMHGKDAASGEYQDFLTGFVTAKGEVWGRPVGVAVGADGALLVSDDGSNTIWRVTALGAPARADEKKPPSAPSN